MFRRPRTDDTDEDLVRQQEEFLAQANAAPAAKLVNKRKTQGDEEKSKNEKEHSKPLSRFAQERAHKKKKEGIIDNTILKEAATREEKACVLGAVVERVVLPDMTMKDWAPEKSPYGFPKPQKLSNLNENSSHSVPGGKKKSLYMQEMERRGVQRKTDQPLLMQATATAPPHITDPRVAALGDQSYFLKDNSSESEKIHLENMNKIATMSHEERLKEQAELLAALPAEQLNFLRSLREKREKNLKETANKDNLRAESSLSNPVNSSSEERNGKGGSDSCKKDRKEVRFPEDVEMKDNSESSVKATADIQNIEDELPIPPSEAKKWVHMEKVDLEKMKWMTNMPKPKPLKNNEGFVARFNFEGDILPYDADISYREALHHHGEEPGRAGYTLDELFVLIRSSVLQQRNIGLRTLANILRNAREGLYDTAVNPPIIQLVVEAGVVLLLRFALDESSHLVYSEAVRALYYLVSSEPDEQCLALAQPWTPAGLQPGFSSQIHATNKARQELDEEETELKDIEIIKLDVIRALIRMDTPVRIRYLLETVKPGPDTVIHALGIMTRMVRHSLTAAWKLVQTPRLLTVILDNFLPHNLSPLLTGENVASMTSVYGVPLKQALTFFKVVAAKGRQLAALLVNTHGLMGRILTYVAVEPSEVGMPLQEALMLSQEAYATWATLLAYGLTKAEEAVSTFYPMLVKQLVFYRDKVPINEDMDKNKFNYDVGAHMIDTLTRALNIAASHSLLQGRMKLNQGTLVGTSGNAQVLPPPTLAWEDLNDVLPLVETCLNKWLSQLARTGQTTFSGLRLVGACCSFLEAYYTKWKDQSTYSGEGCSQQLQLLHNNVIWPYLKSLAFSSLVKSLPNHSSLICNLQPGTSRDPVNLGSLGCVTQGGKVVPVIQPTSPLPLLLPLSSLLLTIHTLHPYLSSEATIFLNSEELSKYLNQVCESNQQLSEQWLTRIEVHLIVNLLQLAACKGCNDRKLYHEAAMCIMTCIRKGDEYLIEKLVTSIICSSDFTSDLMEMSTQVDSLALDDYEPLFSPAIVQPVLSPRQLTENICKCISSMCSELVRTLASKREYESSLVLKNGIHFATNGITINQTEDPMALSKCWPLKPIAQVFKTSRNSRVVGAPQDIETSDQSSPEDILIVTRCLQMAYLALKYRRKSTLHTANINMWLHNLSLVFLVASDMFLDADVSSYLQACIIELLRNGGYNNLDPSEVLDGFSSSMAWYRELVEHFKGVSYGDSTFALFLLIPLQQYWPLDYRTELWGDFCDALPYIRLTPEQVDQFIPMQQFLEPKEEDDGIITKYQSNLGSGNVMAAKNQFLYKVASHHISKHTTG